MDLCKTVNIDLVMFSPEALKDFVTLKDCLSDIHILVYCEVEMNGISQVMILALVIYQSHLVLLKHHQCLIRKNESKQILKNVFNFIVKFVKLIFNVK